MHRLNRRSTLAPASSFTRAPSLLLTSCSLLHSHPEPSALSGRALTLLRTPHALRPSHIICPPYPQQHTPSIPCSRARPTRPPSRDTSIVIPALRLACAGRHRSPSRPVRRRPPVSCVLRTGCSPFYEPSSEHSVRTVVLLARSLLFMSPPCALAPINTSCPPCRTDALRPVPCARCAVLALFGRRRAFLRRLRPPPSLMEPIAHASASACPLSPDPAACQPIAVRALSRACVP